MSDPVAKVLVKATARLTSALDPATASREARMLLAQAAGWTVTRLSVSLQDDMPDEAQLLLETFLVRRLSHEPVAQIIGTAPFYGRRFEVTPEVLTPRADSETLIDLALTEPFQTVLDLGTGSGCLAITLLAERGAAQGLATDISPSALKVAAQNAQAMGVLDRLTLCEADWLDGITDRFDLIVSNPPYVSEVAYAKLAPEVTRFEPRGALTPGGDGLAAYRKILCDAPGYLVPGGRILVEIGFDQATAVTNLFEGAGLDAVAVHPDINGKARIVSGSAATAPELHKTAAPS